MRRLALRAAAIVLLLAAVGLAATSISRVPPLSIRLTTLEGEPLPGAFVAYRYKGYRFNFVDSITYYRPGEVLRADAAAQFRIPGFIELHPPLDTGLTPWIEWVYVPELHHFFGPIGQRSESRPGLLEIDRERSVFELADLSDDPERWSRMIGELERAVQDSLAKRAGSQARYAMPEATREALSAHLREEVRAFVQQHAKTPRTLPDDPRHPGMSEEEREARERRIRKDLEREPFWGPMIERRWPELAAP